MLTPDQAAMYRRLTIGDEALVHDLLAGPARGIEGLEGRTASLVRLAAVIVAGGSAPAYQRAVQDALDEGATPAQVTAVLLAIAPITGSAVVMDAAPKLALALGYDVEAALEDGEVAEFGR
jgi:alkylhydroperoxidase/carboxymuconolactone decarboxylase family protein YurZ